MKAKKGFTLIELIVVLAILAVIAAIAVPTAFGSIEKANVAADKASIDSLNSAIRMAATIEKADTVLMHTKIGFFGKKTPTTVNQACLAAKISPNATILSKGGVTFVPATADSFAHFVYTDKPTGLTTNLNIYQHGNLWSDVYGDFDMTRESAYCNYFEIG